MPEQSKIEIQLGAVAKVVDEYTLVLNRGSNHGVKDGARFLIYGLGEDILDPETKEPLGRLEIVRGIGMVIHTQDTMCTVQSAKTRRPSPTIKTIKKDHRNSTWSLMLGSPAEETVEERQGEPSMVPFDKPKVGDCAKPL